MKTIYYINSQEFYQEDNNLEYFKHSYNKRINIGGKYYTIKGANYDLFEDVISIVITPEIKFSYDIFVPNYKQDVINALEMLGYVKSEVCGSGPNLITNAHLGLYYFTDCDYSNGGMGYVCNKIDHAIPIAAIREDSDKYQWFKFPYDEIDFCENDDVIEEFGNFEGTIYPQKLTPEEIYQKL